eukprot:CAMPEP_0170587502 /NCGR_PEP_ID=MMETSP0224-20130122/10319_1 /TAXON_ID=285029 /ORGANISM="Togula jolla, Strain CCCM 725" /LENGTH=82 /DNA_ID=CAMNT_0010911133 /DNA_START=121 /DNA_END=370 /DNA_ORIENTATION=-
MVNSGAKTVPLRIKCCKWRLIGRYYTALSSMESAVENAEGKLGLQGNLGMLQKHDLAQNTPQGLGIKRRAGGYPMPARASAL